MEQDIDRKIWNLMVRYISNDLNLEETEELLDWIGEVPERTALLLDLHDTWEKTRIYPVGVGENGQMIWNSLRVLIEETEKKKRSVFGRIKHNLPVFLSIIMLFGGLIYYVFSFRPELIAQTQADESIRLTLPESSFVLLDQHSKLSYEYGVLGRPKNEIRLEGSALFKAQSKKGTDLCIIFSHGYVKSKSARFYIDQEHKDYIRVLVFQGSLSVFAKGIVTNSQILSARQEGWLYPNGTIEIKPFNAKSPVYLKYYQW